MCISHTFIERYDMSVSLIFPRENKVKCFSRPTFHQRPERANSMQCKDQLNLFTFLSWWLAQHAPLTNLLMKWTRLWNVIGCDEKPIIVARNGGNSYIMQTTQLCLNIYISCKQFKLKSTRRNNVHNKNLFN